MNGVLAFLMMFQPQEDVDKLKKDLEDLRQRVDGLEKDRSSPAPGKDSQKQAETIFDEGFWFLGKDDRLRIGGSGQIDGRFFPHPEEGDSSFLVRRARLFATGILEDKFSYLMMGRWDQQTPNLHFAWLESQHVPYARVRVGLFKEPFSMEGLHSDQYWDFTERSLGVSNFLQLEDIGAMLYGKGLEDRVEYGLGVFNGRGRSAENNPEKEYVGRVVLVPFAKSGNLFDQLYVGVSGSTSGQDETLTGTFFQTGAGTRLWSWTSGTKVNDTRVRWGADAEWLSGPLAIRGEYIDVTWGDTVLGTTEREFTGSGFFIEGGYVLTGENKRRNKPVFPRKNFDPTTGGWGAWELVGRYEVFTLDKDILQAGLATGTDEAKGFTVGLNSYLNRHMALKIGLQELRFDDHVTVGSHRTQDELALFVRVQFEF